MATAPGSGYGETPSWEPARPRLRLRRLLVSWVTVALAVYVATWLVPGVHVEGLLGAFAAAALIALFNALLPPLIAALRLPFTLVAGFLLVLLLDAWIFQLASDVSDSSFKVDSFWSALAAAVVVAAATVVIEVLLGTNDDDTYTLRVIQRIARHSGERVVTDVPGILYLEIDGLALPVLQRAMRDGHAPEMAAWLAAGTHRLAEWETDLSSQTGASQAGLLLGSNDDIPAFRWVEKESGRLMTCSAPPDCEEIERRHASGHGLLAAGGASRSNLLSGEAEHVILTISRMEAEKKANPGYRAFLANGFNVTRTLVLFFYEVCLEWIAAARGIRRDIRPRGHRGGKYPFLRAALAVAVRDLTVYSLLGDMMKGRPAAYACFAGYDEVAHHSGLERADTLEVLRKLDQQFGRIARARKYAARPYEIVVLSDHGQTQGATFKQRNGYGLDDLVQRSLEGRTVSRLRAGDENDTAVAHAFKEATGGKKSKLAKNDVSGEETVVLGSGNLGLIYLMEEKRRLTLEEIEERHPRLVPALREHPHVGWLLVRSAERGPVVLGAHGARYLRDDRVEGEDPLAGFSPNAAHHLRRTDGFAHVADIMVNSFYDHQLDEGCAFEELISFHGGMGGPQTRATLLYPARLPLPAEAIVGAEAAHRLLVGWRRLLQADPAP
ncbi:MAG TPA: phage holin family protein [Thermoleophilia bacterium]